MVRLLGSEDEVHTGDEEVSQAEVIGSLPEICGTYSQRLDGKGALQHSPRGR